MIAAVTTFREVNHILPSTLPCSCSKLKGDIKFLIQYRQSCQQSVFDQRTPFFRGTQILLTYFFLKKSTRIIITSCILHSTTLCSTILWVRIGAFSCHSAPSTCLATLAPFRPAPIYRASLFVAYFCVLSNIFAVLRRSIGVWDQALSRAESSSARFRAGRPLSPLSNQSFLFITLNC